MTTKEKIERSGVEVQITNTGLLDQLVAGKIPCGPLDFLWDEEGGTPLRRLLSQDHPNALEVFEIVGNSMVGAGLLPGDYIVVDTLADPHHRSLVVAVNDEGAFMCKRFFEGTLVSEKSRRVYKDITASTDMSIKGVVIRVLKRPEDL